MRVVNLFGSLMPSGAEVMWFNAGPTFKKEGVSHLVVATTDEIGPYAPRLREQFDVAHFPMKNSLPDALRLTKYLKETRPDVIHCHSEGKAVSATVARILTRIPLIRTCHNVWSSVSPKHAIRRKFEAAYSKRIAVGRTVYDTELKWGPLSLIWNWVSPDVRIRPNRSLLSSSVSLVTVCNTNETKRCGLMLDLAEKHPEVELTHIGYDRQNVFNREALQSRGLSGRVKSLGPQDNVLELLPEYDAYISTSALEGFSIALCEALVAGLALVIVDTPGVRDIREFAPHAFGIDLAAPRPLADLASSANNQFDYFEQNQESLKTFFSAQRGAEEYFEAYRSVLRT